MNEFIKILYKLALVTLTEGAKQLKERLGEIINYKKKLKKITGAATGKSCFA